MLLVYLVGHFLFLYMLVFLKISVTAVVDTLAVVDKHLNTTDTSATNPSTACVPVADYSATHPFVMTPGTNISGTGTTCSTSSTMSTTQEDANNETSDVDKLIDDLRCSPLTFYGATPNVASHAEFFMSGLSGDIAIVKNSGQQPCEFLLSGLFEIDCKNFFMGAEGNYLPTNRFSRDLIDAKLTCHLIPVQCHVEFVTAREDFSAIVNNLRALEKLIPLKRGNSSVSCL